MGKTHVPFFESLLKAQFSSIAATGMDFITLIVFTEAAGIHYLWSTAMASIVGAIVSFILGRHWVFRKSNKNIFWQGFKYCIASGTILIWNVSGMYLFTGLIGIQYVFSKVIVAVIIGFFISFPLFRYFVYR